MRHVSVAALTVKRSLDPTADGHAGLVFVRDENDHTLGRVAELAGEIQPAGTLYDPVPQVAALVDAIEAAPKSLAWKARARVGERLQWYDTPEEGEHPGPMH